jgi:hypothetical protein
MRTALILPLMLALRPWSACSSRNGPTRPSASCGTSWTTGWSGVCHAWLFDVYGSWWFSDHGAPVRPLVACLFPRTRALVRTLRQKPMQARETTRPAVRGAGGACDPPM